MNRAYKFLAFPKESSKKYLYRVFDGTRNFYNMCLQHRFGARKAGMSFVKYGKQVDKNTGALVSEESEANCVKYIKDIFPEYQDINFRVFHTTIKELDNAWKRAEKTFYYLDHLNDIKFIEAKKESKKEDKKEDKKGKKKKKKAKPKISIMKQEKVLLDGYDIPFPKDLIVYNEDIKGAELRRDLPEGHPYVNTNRIENLKDVPGFKSKTGRQTFTLTDSGWKLDRENNILYITMGKDIKAKIKFRGYRKIEGSIRTVSITHDKTHKWWVVFSCTDVPYKEDVPTTGKSVGIDFGIHNVLADSDGNIIEAPTYFKKTSLQIIKVQQRLDEYKNDKQSRQYIQLSKRLAKLNERIKNQREYYVRMIAKKYTDENDIICLEDLDLRKIAKRKTREEIEVPGWSRKRDKNTKKKLHNIAPGMLRNTIKNTAENKRRCTPMVPSYYTSQTCSKCGDIRKYGDRLILEDPVYICRKCGFELHRDVNAAKVIHQRGLNQLIPKENNFTELGV